MARTNQLRKRSGASVTARQMQSASGVAVGCVRQARIGVLDIAAREQVRAIGEAAGEHQVSSRPPWPCSGTGLPAGIRSSRTCVSLSAVRMRIWEAPRAERRASAARRYRRRDSRAAARATRYRVAGAGPARGSRRGRRGLGNGRRTGFRRVDAIQPPRATRRLPSAAASRFRHSGHSARWVATARLQPSARLPAA